MSESAEAAARRDALLAELDVCWDRLEDALDARDIERIGALVASREPLIARLRALQSLAPLTAAQGQRLVTREAELQRRAASLHGDLGSRLHDLQRRSTAARKYRDSPR